MCGWRRGSHVGGVGEAVAMSVGGEEECIGQAGA